MGPIAKALVMAVLTAAAAPVGAQDTSAVAQDSADGARAGAHASVSGPRWGAAAATFFLSPVLGGVGSLVVAQQRPGVPGQDSAATAEYRRGYVAAYAPRRRRAMQHAVAWTSVVYVAALVAFSVR